MSVQLLSAVSREQRFLLRCAVLLLSLNFHSAVAKVVDPEMSALPTGVVLYMEMAEKGDSDAQYNLGGMYETGFGVKMDYQQAARWYLKAAENGHTLAQIKLGLFHVMGRGVRQSDVRAIHWIEQAAEKNNEFAAMLYDKVLSPDAERDLPTISIAKKMNTALERGEANAKKQLLALLAETQKKREQRAKEKKEAEAKKKGLGKSPEIITQVPDFTKADKAEDVLMDNLALLERDASAGDGDAQYVLGLMHETGQKVNLDRRLAVQWYTSAAEKGHRDAQYRLGVFYIYGTGVKTDLLKGKDYLTRAAEQNHEVASRLLSLLATQKQLPSMALLWYLEKAMYGNADGQFGLGHAFENGWGVPQDTREAKKWYASAREQGSGGAAKRLRQIKVEMAEASEDTPEAEKPKLSTAEEIAALPSFDEEQALLANKREPLNIEKSAPAGSGEIENSKNQPENLPESVTAPATVPVVKPPVVMPPLKTKQTPIVQGSAGDKPQPPTGKIKTGVEPVAGVSNTPSGGGLGLAQKQQSRKIVLRKSDSKSFVMPVLLTVFGLILVFYIYKMVRAGTAPTAAAAARMR